MADGLKDFFKHIQNSPKNDVLIDRFMTLLQEIEFSSRQPYLQKLFKFLLDKHPHGALRVGYFHLQAVRRERPGSTAELEALNWVEQAFVLLGKNQHATLVKQEIERQKINRPPYRADRRKKKLAPDSSVNTKGQVETLVGRTAVLDALTAVEPEPDQRFSQHRQKFMTGLYENYAKQFIDILSRQLQNFEGPTSAESVARYLIKSFQSVYHSMHDSLYAATAVFGHNPLLLDEKDGFREELVHVFSRSALFSNQHDRLTTQRIRFVSALLIAWFDQQQSLPQGANWSDQDRVYAKLLELAISAVLFYDE